MQSGILHRDTMVETRVDVLVFAHGPRLRSTSTAHGIRRTEQKEISTSFLGLVATPHKVAKIMGAPSPE